MLCALTGSSPPPFFCSPQLERALKPVVASALDVSTKVVTFVNVQRRYQDGEVWLDLTVPNDRFTLSDNAQEADIEKLLSHPDVKEDMRKALSKAKIGKGNSPAVGGVEADIIKATSQPTSKPTKSPKDDDVPVKADDDAVLNMQVRLCPAWKCPFPLTPRHTIHILTPPPPPMLLRTPLCFQVEAELTFSGVTEDDANESKFQAAIQEGVADALGVDTRDVEIESVETDHGKVTVTYSVSGLTANQLKAAENTLESEAAVDGIIDNLGDAGYDKVEVTDVDADVTSVGADGETVVTVTQAFDGASVAQASKDDFQDAVKVRSRVPSAC